MSNLTNFQNFRQKCLVCNNDLSLHFMSKGSKKLRMVNNELQIEFEINAFPAPKDKKRFTVLFTLNYVNNNFHVDFLTDNYEVLSFISLSRIKDCQRFLSSGALQFYRECFVCRKYHYNSVPLRFDYDVAKIDDFFVLIESICLSKPIDNSLKKVYALTNNYLEKQATLMYDRQPDDNIRGRLMENYLEIPLVKMSEPEELISRLDTFITFS